MPGETFAKSAPKGDIGKAMEFKSKSISAFQASKENSIKIQSAGRDAVLIVTHFYPPKITDSKSVAEDEKMIQEKIKYWRDWMFNNIYDVPF